MAETVDRPITPKEILRDNDIDEKLIIKDKKTEDNKNPLSPEEQEALLRAQEVMAAEQRMIAKREDAVKAFIDQGV